MKKHNNDFRNIFAKSNDIPNARTSSENLITKIKNKTNMKRDFKDAIIIR